MGRRIPLPELIGEVIASLFKRPSTKRYPLEEIEVPEGFRGKMYLDLDKCISCGLCYRNCPSGAIDLVEVLGKKAPCFHFDTCVFCYLCVEVCPRNAILPSNTFEMATTKKRELEVDPLSSSLRIADSLEGNQKDV